MKKIFILLLPFMLIAFAFINKQTFKISGQVLDSQSTPLVGVSVTYKGSNMGTTTGQDGRYTLEVPDGKGFVVFTYVGYNVHQEPIKNRSAINIIMQPAATSLHEVMVTGIAGMSRSKREYTGYVQTAPTGIFHIPQNDAVYNTEDYDHITENEFVKTTDHPLSTFSIDVDAASYSNIRRYLNNNALPQPGAVRIEEMINYFIYDYPASTGEHPFSFTTELSECPWNTQNKLVLIGMQGKKIDMEHLPPSNLVFLIDVSGSMQQPNKLPLVKASLNLLVDQLREQDRVSMVVYAGAAGLVLPATNGNDKVKIKDAIQQLEAGGSTAGGAGIELAYKTARQQFLKHGNNRVILCTDGDFNVGASSDDAMVRLIEKERESGVYLTVLGYGMGNYKDNKMQKLADKGNGNHAYIDDMQEAKKVLVNEFGGTMYTIAQDVKLQVEFNPVHVQGYRLIGYENRMLQKGDFNNDKKDAGELGSGHTVTALYEIIPAGVATEWNDVDELKYQDKPGFKKHSKELMTIKFRYKNPGDSKSNLLTHAVLNQSTRLQAASANFRFAAAVAGFGMLLRNSPLKVNSSYDQVISLAKGAVGKDPEGYRSEFIKLVNKAALLAGADKAVNK